MSKRKFTYTTDREWDSGGYTLPPIPVSQQKQIELLDRAVHDMFVWLMDVLGWDNPGSIADRLPDEVNRIAHRAYERHSRG